jgi:hypothetical protein
MLQNAPMSLHVHGPINGLAWAEKGLGYSLVGSTAPEALHPIANEVHRRISGVISPVRSLQHECGVGLDASSSPTPPAGEASGPTPRRSSAV